jgi:hypothetical protein
MPLAGDATATATATTMNTITTTSTTPSTSNTTEIDSQSHNISTETETSAHRGDEDTSPSATRPSPSPPAQSPTVTDTVPDLSLTLTPRALKQATALQLHLSQLRATDQRSLAHLPAAEQRALLLAHHKQTENARRSEQKYKGNLAGAGNKTGCLGKIRLVRTPPHFGNVGSLSR